MTGIQTTGSHWIYRYWDASGVLLYLGSTTQPDQRRKMHRLYSPWMRWATDYVIEDDPCAQSRRDADIAEAARLDAELPVFNKDVPGAADRITAYLASIGEDPEVHWRLYPRRGDLVGDQPPAVLSYLVRRGLDAVAQDA